MDNWSNIEVSATDQEIIQINNFEKKLGELSDGILKVRELITRFELCHFKYKIHLRKIKDSINKLDTLVDTERIGTSHPRYGKNGINKDITGKSKIGENYIRALNKWLDPKAEDQGSDRHSPELDQQVQNYLGEKNPDKLRLVKLLLARLNWDWTSMEKLQLGGQFETIENQAARIDICHYTFPQNLDQLINAIGQMKAVDEKGFEGCGSCNEEIRSNLEKEFTDLNNVLAVQKKNRMSKNNASKYWLILCLAKTIKEDIKLKTAMSGIENIHLIRF